MRHPDRSWENDCSLVGKTHKKNPFSPARMRRVNSFVWIDFCVFYKAFAVMEDYRAQRQGFRGDGGLSRGSGVGGGVFGKGMFVREGGGRGGRDEAFLQDLGGFVMPSPR